MKGRAFWAVLLLMAPALMCLPSSTGLSTGHDICITALNPGQPGEYIVLMNTGPSAISLTGYSITDGEGTIAFKDQQLAAYSNVLLAQNRSLIEHMMPDANIIDYADPGLHREGRFTMANDGDQLILLHEGETIDSLCYGDVEPPPGWSGQPCSRPEQGHLLQRKAGAIGSSSTCWSESSAGRVIFEPLTSTADVIPLVFPEVGHAPIVSLIENSTRSIIISVYTLDDEAVVSSLLQAAGRSIDVSILLEGQPVGGLTAKQRSCAALLAANGCDVHLMSDSNSFRRYEFLHAKYGVFDERVLLVTSENWGQGLHNNRGWGAVIRSDELAGRMISVFRNDTTNVWKDLVSPNIVQSIVGVCQSGPVSYVRPWTTAEVTLLVSPYGAMGEVLNMAASARERLLIEQMSFDKGWGSETGMVPAIIRSGSGGAETKVLLDGTSSDLQNRIAIDAILGPRPANVEARLATAFHSFKMIHNKGIISDDSVLISSINFGHNAFFENREVGIIVRSAQIADLFASVFRLDWSPDPDPPHIMLQFASLANDGTECIVIDAGDSWDESGVKEITWDIDLDGVFEISANRAIVPLQGDNAYVLLRVVDNYGNVVERSVEVPAADHPNNGGLSVTPWLGAIPLGILAFVFLRKRIK